MELQQDTTYIWRTSGKSTLDVHLPQYYREGTFFAKDSMLHPEITGGGYGVEGELVPYKMRNDDIITGLLLLCFFISLVIIGHHRAFFARQYRTLVTSPRPSHDNIEETTGESNIKTVLVLQFCLLVSIIVYFFTEEYVNATFIYNSDYLLIALCLIMMIGYVGIRFTLYNIVNAIFFDGKRNKHFINNIKLIMASQGLALIPIVLVLVFFEIPLQTVSIYTSFVIVLGIIFAFYRSYVIFFRNKGGFLQNFMYLCALEIMPLVAFAGIWAMVVDSLKIIF